MGDVSKRLNAIDREANAAFSGFAKIGDRLTTIGTGITAAVSLPLAAAGIAATKFAADFEGEMRKVTSLLGGVTQKEFENLNQKVLEVSRSLGVDATKSAQALYEVISAGVPPNNAIDFLAQASKTAIAGVTDTKVAVDALTTIIAAYNLKTEQAKEVSDAMFQAVNVGKFQFEDLAKAIGPAAAQANNLGISYQELLAATSTLSITSGGVSQAVTQIESAMRALLDPTKEMKAGLQAIGFETGSAAVKTLGFEKTLQELRKQTGGSAEAFNALFGRIEGASGALGLTGDRAAQAAKDYETLKTATAGVGSTQKALDEINKGTTRQYEILAAQLKVTAIELGTALLPAVNDLLIAAKPLVSLLAGIVEAFTKLPQPLQTAAVGLGALVIAIGPAIASLGFLTTALVDAAKAMKFLGEATLLTDFGKALTGNLIGPMTLAQSRVVSFLGVLKGLAVPVTIGIVTYQALDALTKTETATANLTKAMDQQKASLDLLNKKYREQEIAAGRLADPIIKAKESILDFIKGLKAAPAAIDAVTKSQKGAFSDSDRKRIEEFKKEIQEADEKTRLHNQALRELGKEVKEAGDKHKEGTGKVRQFLDLFPELAAKLRIVEAEYQKNVEAVAAYRLAVERGEKGTVDLTEGFVGLEEAIPPLRAEIDQLPDSVDGMKESMEGLVKPIEKVIEAYRRLGLQTPQELQKTVNANREAWEIIVKDSGSQSVAALEAWIKYEESRQEAARRSGQVIPEEQRKGLERAQQQLDAALGKQESSWGKFTQQVSTIINDFAKDLARGTIDLIKNLFDFDGFNKKLREDSEALRTELAGRTDAIEQFRQEVAEKIAGIESGYAEQLAQETGELRSALAERTAEYEQYVADVASQLESFRNTEGERLAAEIGDLADALRDKEAAYQEYQQGVAEREEEIRRTHAERLAEQLADLRDNLADRQQSYDRFVEDANTSLSRIGADLAETIDDATRNINRRIEDENTDFARDEERLNADIRKAELKGDKDLAASLRKQLRQRIEDHEKTIKRLKEDLAEQIDDAKKRAAEQTEDLQKNLQRRAQDHAEFVKENIAAQQEVTEKNRESLNEQLGDLQESLDKRTRELLKFRDETNAAIAAAGERSAERLRKEEQELQGSLDARRRKLDDYQSEVERKIDELTERYARKQAEEVAALNLELENKLKEYDTYRTGVETKLAELEAAHKGPLDRIKEMFVGVFNAAANAILRVASEEVIGKLIGKLTSLIDVVLPGVGKAIDSALGTLTGTVGGAVGAATGGAASGAGSVGGTAGQAAGSGLTSLIGAISGVATAVSSIIGNFQMAGMNKTLDLIERYTRYSEIHLSYILEKVNDYIPKLADIQAFNVNRFDPWLTHMREWTEPGGQWFDRTVQLIDLIAQRVVPPLDQLAMAVTAGENGSPSMLNVRVFLSGREISNAIAESDEFGGGVI